MSHFNAKNIVHKGFPIEAEAITVPAGLTTSDRYKQIFNIALDKHLGTVSGRQSRILLVQFSVPLCIK